MSYVVSLWPLAEARLWDIWSRAVYPDEIAELADNINRILRDAPFDQGESRERADRRVWFHRPLFVQFLIDEPAGRVFVADIRWVGR